MKEEPEIIEINSEEFTENEWLTETDPRVLALTMEGYIVFPPFFSDAEYSAINNAGIDRAFHKYELDCGPVYRVCRHGQVKKCFTRKTAIIHLAHFMTTKVFESSGFEKRLPDQRLMHPEYGEVFHPGEITPEYYRAHGRCFHRLLRILARRKQFDAWMEKYNAWIDQYCRLVAQRPFKKRANHDCN